MHAFAFDLVPPEAIARAEAALSALREMVPVLAGAVLAHKLGVRLRGSGRTARLRKKRRRHCEELYRRHRVGSWRVAVSSRA